MCPNTADSTEVKRDWAQDVLKGMNSVTSSRVLTLFLSQCLETTNVSLGCMSPHKPEVKPSVPQPTEGRGLGCPTKLPGMLCQSCLTKDEANAMLPYPGKEELPR